MAPVVPAGPLAAALRLLDQVQTGGGRRRRAAGVSSWLPATPVTLIALATLATLFVLKALDMLTVGAIMSPSTTLKGRPPWTSYSKSSPTYCYQ